MAMKPPTNKPEKIVSIDFVDTFWRNDCWLINLIIS